MDLQEEIKKRKKDKWIEAWMTFEVLAAEKDVADTSLESHVKELSETKDVLIFDKDMMEAILVKNPIPKIEEAYSKVCAVKLLAKDFRLLLNIVFQFGPSSVEIIEPSKIEISLDEAQDTVNNVAGFLHKFASAGVGGVVIFPKAGK